MEMEKDFRTLRDMVKLDKRCMQKFSEAEVLAKSLFDRPECVFLPYFTPHDASHCKAIERYLDWIIWGTQDEPLALGRNDFRPTPEEAMYLLSATWLHDIGMMYGIRDGEDASELTNSTKVMELRREHEFRAVKYIHEVWKLNCTWAEDEKAWLTNICAYHRRHRLISTFDPIEVISKYDQRPIRLVVLAALLRLADACHEDQSRAPGSLMELYKSLGMPQEVAIHWETAKLITGVHFDHTKRRITLTAYCPSEFNFNDLGIFDLGEIVELARQDVQEELQSVQQVLLPHPNTYLGEVKHVIYHPDPSYSGMDEEKQYLALWPYLLDKPTGSTEAGAALAQMLIFALTIARKKGDIKKGWDDTLRPIMNKTQESRPLDFVIRNLCRGVMNVLSKISPHKDSGDALAKYLECFLNGLSESCRKIAEFAPTLVNPGDVLLVHGYCRNIASFLESLKPQCKSMLYIVDHQEPVGKVGLGPNQNRKMRSFANSIGFSEVRFLPLPSITQALNELNRKGIPCKVLLGTHGVLKSKAFLCKVGSYMIASTAKEFCAQVIVFAEETKFLINGESEEEVAGHEKVFSSEKMCKRHPAMIDTMCLAPEIDTLSPTLVDWVLTEKGAFPPDHVPIPAEYPAPGRANRKKVNRRA